jgi:hypothetical protein
LNIECIAFLILWKSLRLSLYGVSYVHHGLKLAVEFKSSVNYTFISLRIEDHRIIEE